MRKFTMLLLLLSNWTLFAQNPDYNTTIVVNLKKPTDKKFINSFSEFKPYGFDNQLYTQPPNKIISSTPLNLHLKVELTTTSCLMLGFNYFYISPGDSLNFDYETTLDTPHLVIDTLIINHGNVFFRRIKADREPGSFLQTIYETIQQTRNSSSINEYLSEENLTKLIAQYTELTYKQWPNLNKDNETKEFINQTGLNRIYAQVFQGINGYLKDSDENIIDNMLKYASEHDNQHYIHNWERYLSIYQFFVIKKRDASAIISKFENCNEVIKQFILLNLLKDELIDESQVLDKITYAPFKKFEEKIIQTRRGNLKLPEAIINAEVSDVNNITHTLGEIFENSSHPYLIFDFCGTWCKPCIAEIARYSNKKHLDNSKIVKPIWLFFENDTSKWMNIIDKYKLKKENCFIITGMPSRELIKELSILTGWEGEFPRYFLLSKDGAMVNANTVSLSKFSEKSLP